MCLLYLVSLKLTHRALESHAPVLSRVGIEYSVSHRRKTHCFFGCRSSFRALSFMELLDMDNQTKILCERRVLTTVLCKNRPKR